MSDLRPRGIPVMINGEERHLLLTLGVIDTLQDKYNKTLDEIIDDITQEDIWGRTLREVILILLNDEVERGNYYGKGCGLSEVTEREVSDAIGTDNYFEIVSAVLDAYRGALPDPEGGGPNREGGQQSS